ncbi:proline-rich transmembrane protein 1-like [Lytechinus variegatus]|uniref:proline-rich transmembrane protein 1-like n=1 Tax=Lytechinus variegatus TaxID=7654 RepID=UPI001BB1F1D4|nr:proline-rich transmembrane protein 1-like [Lytechinus variegatus]XP_041465788.1 proline-rich transmembrane protein 1-like [Lytechinus variegatus]
MTAEYKKLGKGQDLESGMGSPFLDDPNESCNMAPQAQVMGQARFGQQPNDHLLFAILTTVFCCIPCGIVAIVKSVDVRNKWLVGDVVGATQSARAAKRYSVCSLVFGVLFFCSYVGIMGAFAIYSIKAMKEMGELGQPNGNQLTILHQLQDQQG